MLPLLTCNGKVHMNCSNSLLWWVEEDAVTKVRILPLRKRSLSLKVLPVLFHVVEVRLLNVVELRAGSAPVVNARFHSKRRLMVRHHESGVSIQFTARANTASFTLVHAHQSVEPLLHLVNFMLLHLHLVVFKDVADLFAAPLLVALRDDVAVLNHLTNLASVAL